MAKQNCWEVKKCGREPNGAKAKELGVCAATLEVRVTGVNDGLNGGRCCWAVTGTLCGGKVQGMFASKIANCMVCEFYKSVVKEEGTKLVSVTEILAHLKQL